MILKDISFPSAEENIAYDQILLESAEAGSQGEVLRFWEAKNFFIVLGRISKLKEDVKIEEVKKNDIEIIRRTSGGGTILQGPGCLNFSLILSYERNPLLRNIRKSYEFILNEICVSLRKLHIEAKFEPISDMTFYGRKFSGNAQVRKRDYMLHHGTILYNFLIDMVEKYLKMPKDHPPYRQGRSHSDFLININRELCDIKDAISSAFTKDEGRERAERSEAYSKGTRGDSSVVLAKRSSIVLR